MAKNRIVLGETEITEDSLPYFIAEIGINHNGDMNIAKQLIDWANLCGCDAVKFQKRTVDKVYAKEYLDSYRESPWGTTQRAQKEGLEFGKAEYDEEAHIFAGEVVNTRSVITFQGSSVEELERAFRDSVDDYLSWCAEDGVEPEKPYSGKFNVRLTPLFHSQVAIAAKKMNMSLNSFVEKSLHDEISAMQLAY